MASSDPKTTDKLKTVFVISPIDKSDEDGVDFAKVCLEQIIKPAAKDCGGYAVPERADDHHKPGSVTGKIVKAILDADVCVADLTGRNPNVMYEVAIAHAAGKPVILLQQEPGGPPFDFADERVIHYSLRIDLANGARDDLVGHFKAAHEDEEDELLAKTMNPVRQLFAELMTNAKASDPQKALLDEVRALRSEVRENSMVLAVTRRRDDEYAAWRKRPEADDLVELAERLVVRDRLPLDAYTQLKGNVENLTANGRMELYRSLVELHESTTPDVAQARALRLIEIMPPF